jgi:glycosyltransferase involved in cell wall biosynthesis
VLQQIGLQASIIHGLGLHVWPGAECYDEVISVASPRFPLAPAAPHVSNARSVNIALVTETFPPEINGVAMTLSHLVEGLARRGHRVTVIRPRQNKTDLPRGDGLYRELLCPGVPIPGYPLLRAGLPVRGRLLDAWKTDRPEVVHIATEGPLGYAALSAADKLGIPLASSFHTNFHSYSKHYGFSFLTRPALAYLRHFHNRTRITLSPTAELNAELTGDGFEGMRLLSRGVNTEVFNPARRDEGLRRTWGAGPQDLAVVHVSRLAAEKNYPLLIEAFERIRSAQPSARFVIVGDGPLRKKLARAHPWIRFTGAIPRNDLARHYASADAFLYASMTETFGNVVTEAMASGLPVLAFDYAAPARYIRNLENGLVVPFGNTLAWLHAADTLAASPALRTRLGAAARRTAEGISWTQVVDGFERDLHEVAGLAVPSPSTPATVAL